MTPQELLDKTLVIISEHLTQLRMQATTLTKDGAKGYTDGNSQVVDRYAKILLAMNKTTSTEDALDGLSDEELQALLNESETNVPDSTGETD